jgi:hypothetical protein
MRRALDGRRREVSVGGDREQPRDEHRLYLYDLGFLLREAAFEAKAAGEAARGSESESFQRGRAFAYYEVLSLLIAQAGAFDLPLEDLRLDGLDPDRDLL